MPSLYLDFAHELPDGAICAAEHRRAVDPFSPQFDAPAAAKCPVCGQLFTLAECRALDAAWAQRLDEEVNRGVPVAQAHRSLNTAGAN